MPFSACELLALGVCLFAGLTGNEALNNARTTVLRVKCHIELRPFYQPSNPDQNHSADEGDNDGPDHATASPKSQLTKEPAAKKTTE
jgi:hypothetical protein